MSPRGRDLEDAAPATDVGWRPDPTGRYEWRYWDNGWTNRVASSRPSATREAEAAEPDWAPTAVAAAVPAPEPEPMSAATAAPAGAVALAATLTPIATVAPAAEPDAPTIAPAPSAPSAAVPVRAWRTVTGFFSAFANEPESYHSDRAVDIEFDPRGESVLHGNPANYG